MNFKVPYSIRKSLVKVLPLPLLMGMAVACCKEKEPEPWREVTIDWNWDDDLGFAPPKAMIQREIDNPEIKTVKINLTKRNCGAYYPIMFHVARDSLQTRIDMNPNNITLYGTIFVNSENGAHLPDPTAILPNGMAETDSLWFATHGVLVMRRPPHNK